MNWENIFHWVWWNEPIWNSAHTTMFGQKVLDIYSLAFLYKSIALMNLMKILPISQNVWPKVPEYIYFSLCIQVYSIGELTQDSRVLILSHFSCSPLFFVFSGLCR